MTADEFRALPLEAIGGRVGGGKIVTLLAHSGRIPRFINVGALANEAAALPDGNHIIRGDCSNPMFSWPVYAAVRS